MTQVGVGAATGLVTSSANLASPENLSKTYKDETKEIK